MRRVEFSIRLWRRNRRTISGDTIRCMRFALRLSIVALLLFGSVAWADVEIPPPLPCPGLPSPFCPPEDPGTPDPVIIIPGILGSEEHNGVWVIDPILHTYDDLIATLDANGYTPEQDLFAFPFNWRKSNVETALLLKQKIDEVKGICACDKVDLVAHSMGGLVARQYIQSAAYQGDVDQLIFLGTPHLGAPKAYLMWEGGEIGPLLEPLDTATEIILGHEAAENGFPHLFDYIRTVPIDSVRELLPVHDYIFDVNTLRTYPENYPRNSFLENLNANVSNLLNSGVEIHNIIGETQTQQTIIGVDATDPAPYLPKWLHGYPEDFYALFGDHGLVLGQGDRTVPFNSASYISENLQVTTSTHISIPDNSKSEIFKVLTGNDASTLIDNINLPNIKLLVIKILSPADLLVVAPDGSKIGKDFNGLEVNQIPNAFYTGFTTDTEFITILNPLDAEYKVFSQGTGSGSYTVEVDYVSEATTTGASFSGNTGPGITSELNLALQNATTTQLSVERIVTLESTLADLERIYTLGWISKKIYQSTKEKLKAAFKTKKGKTVIDKAKLRDILRGLKKCGSKELTQQGYLILKEDIEWLITS